MFRRNWAILALAACLACPPLLLAVPDDPFTVSSGEQSATQKSGEVEFRQGTDPTAPFFTLSAENREQLLMTGVDVLTQFIPGGQLVNKSVHLAVFSADAAIDAADFKSEKVAGDLLALAKDAGELKELQRTDKHLQSKEAKEILDRMQVRKSDQNDEYSFLRKAVFSGDGLYVVARNAAAEGVADFLGEKLSKALHLDDVIKKVWKNDGTLKKGLKKKVWEGLKRRAEIGKKLTESLKESLLQAAAVDYLVTNFKAAFDALYHLILARNPPSAGGPPPEPANGLRILVSTQPVTVLPTLAQIPVPRPAPQMAQAIRPIIAPAIIVRYPDPVVAAIAAEDQVVRAQGYSVAPATATAASERVSYPPLETPRANDPPPVAEPPTPREPSRTTFRGNLYVSPNGFDGDRKDLWH
jgi:hypothetical protein